MFKTCMYTCRITRPGLNGISTCSCDVFSQSMIFSTSSFVIWNPSQLRIADSISTRTVYGNLSGKGQPSTGLSAVILSDVRSIVFTSWKQLLKDYYCVPFLHHYSACFPRHTKCSFAYCNTRWIDCTMRLVEIKECVDD